MSPKTESTSRREGTSPKHKANYRDDDGKWHYRTKGFSSWKAGKGSISVDSLASYVQDTIGCPREKARRVVRTVLRTIIAGVHAGDSVTVPYFGTFYPHASHRYYKFHRGGKVRLDRVAARFRPSAYLRTLVNKEMP